MTNNMFSNTTILGFNSPSHTGTIGQFLHRIRRGLLESLTKDDVPISLQNFQFATWQN